MPDRLLDRNALGWVVPVLLAIGKPVCFTEVEHHDVIPVESHGPQMGNAFVLGKIEGMTHLEAAIRLLNYADDSATGLVNL